MRGKLRKTMEKLLTLYLNKNIKEREKRIRKDEAEVEIWKIWNKQK